MLYNKDRTPEGITIKPDLSCEDRQSESLLLSERWALIQSGVDRRDIKIHSSIYVKGKKHGFVNSTGLKRLVAVDASHPPVTTTELDAATAVSRSSPQQPTIGDEDHSTPTAMNSTDDQAIIHTTTSVLLIYLYTSYLKQNRKLVLMISN